jgi:orotidine-5'-phosphate decarboxylase
MHLTLSSTTEPRIIVALDFKDEASTMALVEQLEPSLCRLKVGKELFVRCGPLLVEKLIHKGFDVFLDLKFHDIPNTVAAACRAAADMGVWMVNVHASGGRKMMQYAREAIETSNHKPILIGVTILTSLSRQDIAEVGLDIEPANQVLRLAQLANESGLDGVVCSPHEVSVLKQKIGNDFCLVTPGVRPAGAAMGDQQRVMTPAQALEAGSDYLVIGRPITASQDPIESLKNIINECQSVKLS